MANTDRPMGFRPANGLKALNPYDRSAGSATAIYIDDLVTMESTGMIIAAAAADTQLVGSAQVFATGSAAKSKIMVADDPDQRFIAQDDGDTTASAAAHVGINADILATAGSLTTLLSAMEIDISTVSTVTYQVRLLDLVDRSDNAWGSYAEIVCVINEHFQKTTTGV